MFTKEQIEDKRKVELGLAEYQYLRGVRKINDKYNKMINSLKKHLNITEKSKYHR